MPKWLQGMAWPTMALWFYALILGGLSGAFPEGVSKRADFASGVALSLIVASWVMADARKRGRELPYDFDSFIFFAWPVILPIYLLQTRKLRIFLTLLFLGGVWLLAWAGAFVVSLIAGDTEAGAE